MTLLVFNLLLLLLTGGCSPASHVAESPLKRELDLAKKQKERLEQKVEALEKSLAFQEIEKIRKEIEKFDRSKGEEEAVAHFEKPRAILVDIIQTIPACAASAQGTLDQILALITNLSDEKVSALHEK